MVQKQMNAHENIIGLEESTSRDSNERKYNTKATIMVVISLNKNEKLSDLSCKNSINRDAGSPFSYLCHWSIATIKFRATV